MVTTNVIVAMKERCMEMIDDSRFTYDKEWAEIYQLLEFAEAERAKHKKLIHDKKYFNEGESETHERLQGVAGSLLLA